MPPSAPAHSLERKRGAFIDKAVQLAVIAARDQVGQDVTVNIRPCRRSVGGYFQVFEGIIFSGKLAKGGRGRCAVILLLVEPASRIR